MDTTLFRYWFFPKRWRRWSDGQRFSFVALTLCLIGGLSFLPLILLPTHVGEGFVGYGEEVLGMLFFFIVNVSSALAGSTLITRERDLRTWEALAQTPIGIPAIVRGKWLARTLFAVGSVGLFVPFWLVFTAVILSMNDGETRAYYTASGEMPHAWVAARLGIFLLWLAMRVLGHAIPFVSIGLLVSACCSKTRTAIALTAGIVVLILPTALYFLMIGFNLFHDSRSFSTAFGLWPILPNSFEAYTAGSLVSSHWANDLFADIFWIVLLPILLVFCASRISRRLERPPSKWKVKSMPHGV
jgi:ABC-type Na+ efflux pump permease subunit